MAETEIPNFAKKEDFAKQVGENLISMWRQLKSNREAREQRWKDAYDLWTVDPDSEDAGRNYKGRANLNLPQVRKEIETMSRRIMKGLFQDDYLKAEPSRFENEELAITNALIVRHYFDNIMNVKHAFMPWVKQGVAYGTSPLREYWKKETNKQFYKKREFKVGEGGILIPKQKVVYEEVVTYDAPFVEACDMFQTWVYPETASSPRHIESVFFRTKVTLETLREKEKLGLLILPKDIEEIGKENDQEFEETQERLAAFGSSGDRKAPLGTKYYDLLEVWTKLEVPVGGKRVMLPCVVEILNETYTVRIQQNPFWHQSIPFQFMRYIMPMPGEFYGRGLPEASISLQNQLNDVLNQMMDSATLSLQPITIINPAFAPNADSFEVEPGAIWWADPEAVKPFTFPDLTGVGIQNASLLKGMITEISDNSPQLPDPVAGKARSTGQAQLAINEWQTDLYNFIDQIATEALNPLAKQTHILLQQNLTDDQVFRVAGKYAQGWVNRVVTPEQVVGNYDFRWIGSVQIENQSVKTQQMLNLLKILPTLPPNSGVQMNWQNFMVKLMRDGFQMKDIESIIETDNMKAAVDPMTENRILELNGVVDVHHTDEDAIHVQVHQKLIDESKDPYVRAQAQLHINKHLESSEKKKQAMMMQQQMMAMQMQAQGPQKPPQPGRPDNPMGNQGQMSQSTNPADFERGLRG